MVLCTRCWAKMSLMNIMPRAQRDRQQDETGRDQLEQEVFQHFQWRQAAHQRVEVVAAQEMIDDEDEQGVNTGNAQEAKGQHRADQVHGRCRSTPP